MPQMDDVPPDTAMRGDLLDEQAANGGSDFGHDHANASGSKDVGGTTSEGGISHDTPHSTADARGGADKHDGNANAGHLEEVIHYYTTCTR
jgi:hypothetical protein